MQSFNALLIHFQHNCSPGVCLNASGFCCVSSFVVAFQRTFPEACQLKVATERSAVSGTVPHESVTVRHNFVVLKYC